MFIIRLLARIYFIRTHISYRNLHLTKRSLFWMCCYIVPWPSAIHTRCMALPNVCDNFVSWTIIECLSPFAFFDNEDEMPLFCIVIALKVLSHLSLLYKSCPSCPGIKHWEVVESAWNIIELPVLWILVLRVSIRETVLFDLLGHTFIVTNELKRTCIVTGLFEDLKKCMHSISMLACWG